VNNLESKLNAFDMDKIPLIIEQFPAIIKALEALI
jgi:hypothetical protein